MLIPAHNEEALIGATLDSVLRQSVRPDRLVVVADNCTDRTVEIARGRGVEVFETVGNTARKAGALNQAFSAVDCGDYVVQADADVVYDEDLVRELLGTISAQPGTGAVTTRIGSQDFPGGGPVAWLVWKLQRLEWYYYDSMKVAARGRVWCMSGVAGIYRADVLREIAKARPGPWDEESVVEDYTVSLEIKERGWATGSAMGAFAWSDMMPSFRALWHQRMRWNAGTFIEWRRREKTDVVRDDRRAFRRALVFLPINFVFLAVTGYLVLSGRFAVNALSLVLMVFFLGERAYRLRYLPRRTTGDYVVALTLVPELCYRLFLDVNLVVARLRAVGRRPASQVRW